jgi:hypothetical protein
MPLYIISKICFIPTALKFPLEYIIKKVQNKEGVESSGPIKVLIYCNVHLLGDNISTINNDAGNHLEASKEIVL